MLPVSNTQTSPVLCRPSEVSMSFLLQVREYLARTGGQLPRVEHASAFARYSGPDAASHAHEAGCACHRIPHFFTLVRVSFMILNTQTPKQEESLHI